MRENHAFGVYIRSYDDSGLLMMMDGLVSQNGDGFGKAWRETMRNALSSSTSNHITSLPSRNGFIFTPSLQFIPCNCFHFSHSFYSSSSSSSSTSGSSSSSSSSSAGAAAGAATLALGTFFEITSSSSSSSSSSSPSASSSSPSVLTFLRLVFGAAELS